MLKRILKIFVVFILTLIGILAISSLFIYLNVRFYKISTPKVKTSQYDQIQPIIHSPDVFSLGNNWIRKNRYHVWEMYVEGNPYDRGVIAGKLSEKLVKEQEEVFVTQIEKVVPSKFYRKILLDLIFWFNRNLPSQIKNEYLEEIYGISQSASHNYDEYGSAYQRLLNYHAAHDIGHALQSYNLVGCSSFATWNNYSTDSLLIVGRNFDFYFGDDFAKNKIVEFVSPDSGYKFAFVTWGGMMGVVSGMNEQGLTVTVNAGTLGISYHSATPVTIVAREILQYANNIEKALQIASANKIFVSESFLIGSANDKKAIIIEKRPSAEETVWPDSSALLCTNHYQGKQFASIASNVENRTNEATGYRFNHLKELINAERPINPLVAASILRNRDGLHGIPIGYGNEKALNQLLAHHSVIFEPERRIMWVSTSPTILGPYVAYDLRKIFSRDNKEIPENEIDERTLEISADTFVRSNSYNNYLIFRSMSSQIRADIKNKGVITDSIADLYLSLNPEYFETYLNLADYYFNRKNYSRAKVFYNIGLQKETNTKSVRDYMTRQLKICDKKIIHEIFKSNS